jgi:3-hydroxyisobutyrate dehydrogenase-like beta-hydroxyacid dehydrogenase
MSRDAAPVSPALSFIGFGDLAESWVTELRRRGFRVRAYLPVDSVSRRSGSAARREHRSGITAMTDLTAALSGADIIVAAIPGGATSWVAEECVPHLTRDTLYVDPSAGSPRDKQRSSRIITPSGALYVDVAVLGTVSLSGLAVPLIASGPGAERFAETASRLGMNVKPIGPVAGDAARLKLIRSVYMKGRDALLVEMLAAARRLHVEEEVIDSISTAPGEQVSFRQLVDRVLPALTRHSERRAEELLRASVELERMGMTPTMAVAAAERLQWMAAQCDATEVTEGAPSDEVMKTVFDGADTTARRRLNGPAR